MEKKRGHRSDFKRFNNMEWCYMTIFCFILTVLCCVVLYLPVRLLLDNINEKINGYFVYFDNYLTK